MKTQFFRFVLPTIVVLTSAAAWAVAGDWGCCCLCGRDKECCKRCKLVCEDKKVEVVCWGCKCEDFCAPGCGRPGCEHCEEVCKGCNGGDNPDKVCCEPKTFLWRDWTPWGKPRMYTKTKLMKKVEVKKVPSYKWVVEDVCAQCEPQYPNTDKEMGVVPPAPGAEGDAPAKAPKKEKK